MTNRIFHAATLLVPEYDLGIEFYVGKLGFILQSDIDLGGGKRWVMVATDKKGTSLLIAKATDAQQEAAIGNQTGGRVSFFLHTDDFDQDYASMLSANVTFEEQPRIEPYGKVAVWRDPFGNRWDLLQLY